MRDYNEKIKSIVFRRYNIFAAFKQSGYLTLTDKSGYPVTVTINGKKYFFTFNKLHKAINIGEKKSDLSFYEKLYIANALNPKVKWVNLPLWRYKIALKRYVAVEPRHLNVRATPSSVNLEVLSFKDKVIAIIILIFLL